VLIYFVEQGLARLEELVSPGQPWPSWLEETGPVPSMLHRPLCVAWCDDLVEVNPEAAVWKP